MSTHLLNSGALPPGAEDDPRAPWNEPEGEKSALDLAVEEIDARESYLEDLREER